MSVTSTQGRAITWLEAGLLTGLVGLGVALRFAFVGRLAIEHFDEGVYASNVWFDGSDGFGYPQVGLYAPPLLPLTIEALLLCGLGDRA